MIDALFSNAMTWVHFRLSGGMRNLLIFCFAYAVLVGGAVLLTSNMNGPQRQMRAYEAWATGLLALQVFGVVDVAPIRVFSAIRHDITTRRIESHRLMPIGSVQAMIGYLIGQNVHLAALFAVNVIIVLVVGSFGGNSAGAGYRVHAGDGGHHVVSGVNVRDACLDQPAAAWFTP